MFINILIFAIVLFFLIFYYKETVVVLAPISQFLDTFRTPFNLPSSFFGLIALAMLFLAFFNFKKDDKEEFSYPFKFLTVLMIFSYFLSDFGRHISVPILKVVTIYIYPIILWKFINTPNQAKLFIKSLIIYLTFVCLYGFYELITSSNPVIEFFMSQDIAVVGNSDRFRYGVKRLQSFLTYNGALGLTCGFGFVTLAYLKIHFKQFIKVNEIFIVALMSASFLCVIFTGTRSVIAGLLVGSLMFLDPNVFKKYTSQYILVGILALLLFSFSELSGFFSQIVASFQNAESVEGSSSELRRFQLDFCLHFWRQSPIFGNGPGYAYDLVLNAPETIFGLESVWFHLLVDYGVVGCVAFFLSILFPIVKLIQNNMFFLIFLPLLFLADKTLSLIPGISLGFHLLFVVFFLKIKELSICHKQEVLL